MAKLLDRVIIIDLESTCWNDQHGNYNRPDGQQSEIIEIGVCELDVPGRQIVSSESILVCPVRSTVSEFCTQLTTLTQEQVEAGISLHDACKKLRKHYRTDRRIWASWGDYDRVQFERTCKTNEIKYPFGRTHLNIKTLFALHHALKSEIGMDQALDFLKIKLEGTHHRGVDDAKNIAKLLLTLLPKKGN